MFATPSHAAVPEDVEETAEDAAEETGADPCPSCGHTGSFVGPEPYTCLSCGYVLTVEEDDDNG